MSNSTIVEVVHHFTEVFVEVPGVVIGGWVGFGLFIVLLLAALVGGITGHVPYGSDLYELVGYALVMVVVYLLAACEQFVFARSDDDDVNLLMVVANAVVWVWVVMGSGRRVPNRPAPQIEKYGIWVGVLAQLLVVVSVFVWNGAVFALWALAMILSAVAIGHYGVSIVDAPGSTRQHFSVHWLAFSLLYSLLYLFLAFLSHLYLGVMSLSGAVWGYLVMHLIAYAWMFYASRNKRAPLVNWGAPLARDPVEFNVDIEAAAAAQLSGHSPEVRELKGSTAD